MQWQCVFHSGGSLHIGGGHEDMAGSAMCVSTRPVTCRAILATLCSEYSASNFKSHIAALFDPLIDSTTPDPVFGSHDAGNNNCQRAAAGSQCRTRLYQHYFQVRQCIFRMTMRLRMVIGRTTSQPQCPHVGACNACHAKATFRRPAGPHAVTD